MFGSPFQYLPLLIYMDTDVWINTKKLFIIAVLVRLTSAIVSMLFNFSQTAGAHVNKIIYQIIHQFMKVMSAKANRFSLELVDVSQ